MAPSARTAAGLAARADAAVRRLPFAFRFGVTALFGVAGTTSPVNFNLLMVVHVLHAYVGIRRDDGMDICILI